MALIKPEFETAAAEVPEYPELRLSSGFKAPTAATYWRTLLHLRWSQLGHLAIRRLLPRRRSPVTLPGPVGLRDVSGRWRFLDWQPEASRKMLAAREFTFLNQRVFSDGAIPWNDRRLTKLWLYHLNYFDFLNVDFAMPEEEPMVRAALEIALDWCRNNTKGTEVGWEPYALSVRIINWLKFLARHGHALEVWEEGRRINTLLESLGSQVATLERHLEKDLLGNHLLKNITALLFAGALLETPSSLRWWANGEALLEEQLNEQILPDGGHFERSPMYHAQILEDLAEIRFLCEGTGKKLACPELLSRKIGLMAQFLSGILHPDGDIPLFNDSALGARRMPTELLTPAELADVNGAVGEPRATVFPDSGYGVIRSPMANSTLIFDCGPLGPDYQPGHGHCDVLSYELSLHGQRVVVDTGVSTYEPGPDRHYERSTSAHNTVRIDGEEQAEIWASFRVGRRPHVEKINGGTKQGFPFVSGEHSAYWRLGVVHAREIFLCPPDTWIVVDLLRGSGSHLIESFLHFHPDVCIKAIAGTQNSVPAVHHWSVDFGGHSYLLAAHGDSNFDLLQSWYSRQFGNRQPSTALRWAWQGNVPTGMMHVFAPAGTPAPSLALDWAGNSINIGGNKIPLC